MPVVTRTTVRTLVDNLFEATQSVLRTTKDWTAAQIGMLVVFVLTLFLSATLLMSVQPMIGNLIRPLLGGTPAVWNTCMVFFMGLLLAGYMYSHFTTRWLGVRKQAVVHLIVLTLPFFFFPIAVNRDLIRSDLENPIPQLLLLLVLSVGMPFFVVSTSAPLLQKWFSSTRHPSAKDPYFLYGASNLGSLIGLLSYPSLIEANLGLHMQSWVWAVCYTLLVLCIGGCAAFLWLMPPAKTEAEIDSDRAKEAENQSALALAGATATAASIQAAAAKVGVARSRGKKNRRGDRAARDSGEAEPEPLPVELSGDVTWLRRLRWVLLAAVPSSLMLGVTTYMTTDIAAIAFLWVLPLAVYLLTFIIVFAKFSPVGQSVVVFLTVEATCLVLGTVGVNSTSLGDSVIFLLRAVIFIAAIAGVWILTLRVPNLIHVCCVGTLPLIVLLLVFMMLSDIKPPKMAITIGIHLVTLFIVAMVCHGELARDRPTTKHLTEFFLWMSFGGVVGGIFNALIAPLIFNAIVEYQLAMVAACLLLPPLGMGLDERWGYNLDLGLLALCLTVGTWLIGCRLWVNDIPFARLEQGPALTCVWLVVAVLLIAAYGLYFAMPKRGEPPPAVAEDTRLPRLLIPRYFFHIVYATELGTPFTVFFAAFALNLLGLWVLYKVTPHDGTTGTSASDWMKWGVLPLLMVACLAVNVGLAYFLSRWRARYQRMQRVLDLALPLAVLLLVMGLVWGLRTRFLGLKIVELSQALDQMPDQIGVIITFGIPAVLCYTFAERATRFGLAVGAVVLAGAFTSILDDKNSTLYQERSFFGVLRVSDDTISHTLVHGTTTHGRQFTVRDQDLNAQPLTYYHRNGPIGHVCQAYNGDDDPVSNNLGVIGLGTGTMAAYARNGQNITFYDIDPVVRKITFDNSTYFTYIQQAKERGAHVQPLVLGDARLTLERQHLKDDEKYRILVIDAFSSDAIPIHLITYQALLLYLDSVTDDGIVCFHISNRWLNLKPVLGNLANKYRREKDGGLVAYYMEDPEPPPGVDLGKAGSTWVVVAKDRKYLTRLRLGDRWDKDMGLKPIAEDDKSSPHTWKDAQPTLRLLGVQASALEPHWFPVAVEPDKGEWTDDYAAIFKVFLW